MGKNWNLVLAVAVGGLAVHGAIVACGNINSHSKDAGALDAQAADAPAPAAMSVPPGTIVAFAGTAVPEGWLLCDGSAVSRTSYAILFGAVGISFGGGDGIASFNLPDLRGRFLRGADNGAGRDPDAAGRTASNPGGSIGDTVGTLQPDQFASHRHALTDPGHSHVMATTNGISGSRETAGTGASGFDYIDSGGTGPTVSASTTGITEAAAGGSETRPKNIAVNYIVKS
jgi:microcystin-dependent protein